MRIKTDKIYLASSNFPTTPSTKTWKLVRAAIKDGIFGLAKSHRLFVDTFGTGPTLSAGTFDGKITDEDENGNKIIRYGDEITTYQIDFNNKLYTTGKMNYKDDLTRDAMVIDVFTPGSYSEDKPIDEHITTWTDILLNGAGTDKEKAIKSVEYFYVIRDTRGAFKSIFCIIPDGNIIVKTHHYSEEIGKYIDGELVLFGDRIDRVKSPQYVESSPEETTNVLFGQTGALTTSSAEPKVLDKGTWFDPMEEMKELLEKQSSTMDLMMESMGKLLDISKVDNEVETWTPVVGMLVLVDGDRDPWIIVDFNSNQDCFWIKPVGLVDQSTRGSRSGRRDPHDCIDERADALTDQISAFIDDYGRALHDDLIDGLLDMQSAIGRQARSFSRRSCHSNLRYRRGGQVSDDGDFLLRRVHYANVKPFKIEL